MRTLTVFFIVGASASVKYNFSERDNWLSSRASLQRGASRSSMSSGSTDSSGHSFDSKDDSPRSIDGNGDSPRSSGVTNGEYLMGEQLRVIKDLNELYDNDLQLVKGTPNSKAIRTMNSVLERFSHTAEWNRLIKRNAPADTSTRVCREYFEMIEEFINLLTEVLNDSSIRMNTTITISVLEETAAQVRDLSDDFDVMLKKGEFNSVKHFEPKGLRKVVSRH